MNRGNRRYTGILVVTAWLACLSSPIFAQAIYPASDATATEQTQSTAPLAAAQLDQLTAPIALYPDPLLGEILTGATYPLEIVLSARWLEQPAHAVLRGNDLAYALQQQDWDASIKALVSEPQVLRMLNQNLQWTEDLGNAFLQQPAAVMDSIQRLRQAAVSSGALKSTPQQSVSDEDGSVIIEPPSPDVIYIPCYGPGVYGTWSWPAYPPFYPIYPVDFCTPGPYITFGISFGILAPYWGWYRWHWRGHGLYRGAHGVGFPGRPWRFNPMHRRGVPYPNAATARRYLGPNAQAWRRYRGFPGGSSVTPRAAPRMRSGQRRHPGAPLRAPIQRAPGRTPFIRQLPGAMHNGPPAFQSYGPGSRARSQAARGAFSRSSPRPQGRFRTRSGGGRPGGGGHPGGGPSR